MDGKGWNWMRWMRINKKILNEIQKKDAKSKFVFWCFGILLAQRNACIHISKRTGNLTQFCKLMWVFVVICFIYSKIFLHSCNVLVFVSGILLAKPIVHHAAPSLRCIHRERLPSCLSLSNKRFEKTFFEYF